MLAFNQIPDLTEAVLEYYTRYTAGLPEEVDGVPTQQLINEHLQFWRRLCFDRGIEYAIEQKNAIPHHTEYQSVRDAIVATGKLYEECNSIEELDLIRSGEHRLQLMWMSCLEAEPAEYRVA